jgi:glycosyltransferase involved in cell wall biosynthesis
MKVILACRMYYPELGGIETSIFQMSKALTEQGHEVVIITTTPKAQTERSEYAVVYHVSQSQSFLRYFPNFLTQITYNSVKSQYADLIDSWKPDCVICRDSLMTNAICDVNSEINVVYVPSMDVKRFYQLRVLKTDSLKRAVINFLERWANKIEIAQQSKALNNATINVAFCENVKRQLMESYGMKSSRCVVKPAGCSLDTANMNPYQRGKVVRLLFVGRLSPEKNVQMLIDALSKLKSREYELVVVGDGIEKDVLSEKVQKLDFEENINFVGYQDEVIKYYYEADYLILPSKYESFGQVIIEAMTCGTPVIGFASIEGVVETAVDELVDDENTGFICKNFSAEGLSKTLNKAMDFYKTDAYLNMRRSCEQRAKENYSWDSFSRACLSAATGLNN